MTETPRPKCPYCGEKMELCHEPHDPWGEFSNDDWCYWCEKCIAYAPVEYTEEEALSAALRRPLQQPIPLDDILFSPFQIPCWIERKKNGRVGLVADVLDRSDYDRFFGQVDANMLEQGLVEHMTRYRADNYGKTWRCWASRPTDEERAAAKWEE